MHVEDLIEVERRLGYRYQIPGSPAEHYQWICPPCRRASYGMAQSLLWRDRRGGRVLDSDAVRRPMPRYANTGLGEGPLGPEDAGNFHP